MSAATPSPLVEIDRLEKFFPLTRTATEYFRGQSRRAIHAVDGVSLAIRPGESIGLIGESGSGKTTLGWLVARLHTPTGGSLRFEGQDIGTLEGAELRHWRRNVQVVFQDPVGSLDPRLKVWQIVGEPIRAQEQMDRQILRRERPRIRQENRRRAQASPPEPALPDPTVPHRLTRDELRARVREALPTVGLPPDCLDQYAHEFSGGGRQRLSLARAFSVHPKLVILDEPTSALDVAVQAQILNRLVELQRERNVAYLLITHNVAAVRYVADRVAVMYLGQIVEVGSVHGVLEHPVHPYTKALLAAVPVADARRRRTRFRIGGDVPSLVDPPPGCRFAPRCPFVIDRCRVEDPKLREIVGLPGQLIACHRAEDVKEIPPASLLTTAGDTTVPTVTSPTATAA
ncbi:MAG TPA: ABC transporter ATP-binding protein [Thermoplasmata archaeon]|nr:ABC transporter ATP-binding protein [Thermoplasmata archaeon]